MNFLLISGPQPTGKISLVRRMHTYFINQGYNITKLEISNQDDSHLSVYLDIDVESNDFFLLAESGELFVQA